MADSVKIDIDISTGKISIECPETSLEPVFQKVQAFVSELSNAHQSPPPSMPRDQPPPMRRPAQRIKRESTDNGTAKNGGARAVPRASGRPGPQAVLQDLADEGFFATKKNIEQMRIHIKDKRGHDFDSKDLSVGLLRLVRNKTLERETNQDGQYEYIRKS